MADADHPFLKPDDGASRSPCPALNTLANHGFLPRDGKNISFWQLKNALMEVYGISTPFAALLAGGAIAKCGNGFKLDLGDLAAHNKLEHDASMAHLDINEGNQGIVNPKLVEAMVADTDGVAATEDDFIKMKIRRERETHVKYISGTLQNISRGEIVIAMSTMVDHATGRMPVEWIRVWFGEERLPDGWKRPPPQSVGLLEAHKKLQAVNKKVDDGIMEVKE